MTPILFLTSDSTPARHVARIAAGLHGERFRVEVHPAPLRLLDWTGTRNLKRIASALKPVIIHAWGPEAARATFAITSASSGSGHHPRLVVSDSSFVPATWTHWPTRRRLRSCDRVVSSTWVEAERYRGLGVPAERLTRIAPGIEPSPASDRAAILQSLDLPANARFIVAGGRLNHDAGVKNALWGFDLVRHEYPDLYLVILGEGPARDALHDYARATMPDTWRARFVGDRADGASIIAAADFAWIVHPRGDVRFALDAMAAGVPVFAWRLPEMAELIEDGVTGLLADPGQPTDLAKKTYPLITDSAARIALGEAGLALVRERFTASRELEHYASLYSELQ